MEQIAFDAAPSLIDGYGYGSGSGSGSGYGYGYGSGSGYGYGYGYGSGDGFGYGYGDGDGFGYGYGDGFGDGSGDGFGYGSGDGSGSGDDGLGDGSGSGDDGLGDEQNKHTYHAAITGNYQRDNAVLALWKTTKDAKPANGGTLAPVKIGDVHETRGPLVLCHSGTLHATFDPDQWKGARLWIVALYGEIAVSHDKLGALKREIIAEVTG